MIKPTYGLKSLLLFTVFLSGCMPSVSSTAPTPTKLNLSATEIISPLPTSTTTLIEETTPTMQPTLIPEEVNKTIATYLQDPSYCQIPCFLGIEPGLTTLIEALDIFSQLGFRVERTTFDNKDFYGVYYEFEGGPSLLLTLTILDEKVKNLRVDITPELQKPDELRSWSTYSPESLIKKHGTPSRVDFFLGRHEPLGYSMQIYFETADLIIQYGSYDITFVSDGIQVCPLTDQFDSIRVWLGKNPEHPPGLSVSLEEASSLNLQEFANLMLGKPEDACLNLNSEAFP